MSSHAIMRSLFSLTPLFLPLLLVGCSRATGSSVAAASEDVPPHIRHYLDRVDTFEKENVEIRNVILLGDSLTEGFDVARHFPGKRVLNRGISSDTIGIIPDELDRRGVLKRLDASVFDCDPSHVFLMIGVNDLGDKHTPEEMAVGYREILETIRMQTPDVVVHIQSLLPTGGKYAFHNANIREFNRRSKALAEEMAFPYIDLNPLFSDENGDLRAELTREGLHLTEAGYVIWKAEIDKAMGW